MPMIIIILFMCSSAFMTRCFSPSSSLLALPLHQPPSCHLVLASSERQPCPPSSCARQRYVSEAWRKPWQTFLGLRRLIAGTLWKVSTEHSEDCSKKQQELRLEGGIMGSDDEWESIEPAVGGDEAANTSQHGAQLGLRKKWIIFEGCGSGIV